MGGPHRASALADGPRASSPVPCLSFFALFLDHHVHLHWVPRLVHSFMISRTAPASAAAAAAAAAAASTHVHCFSS